MFNKETTEAVLIVDASNIFNAINREGFFHNTKKLCLSTYIDNCYSSQTDLYIQGGRSIKSEEATTQGYPKAMAIHTLSITSLLAWLRKKSRKSTSISASKQAAFADDFNGIGTVESLQKW